MGRLNPWLRILDWMIGTAVAAAILQSEIDPLIQPDRKYLLVFTLGVYPLAVFPPYCIFRARRLLRGGSLTRTDYLATAVWLLSLVVRVHSHVIKSNVYAGV